MEIDYLYLTAENVSHLLVNQKKDDCSESASVLNATSVPQGEKGEKKTPRWFLFNSYFRHIKCHRKT